MPTRADVKHVHASGSTTLMSIAKLLSAFNTTLATSLAPPVTIPGIAPSPIHHCEAITLALTLEKNWLTVTECANFLKSDLCAADVYMALDTADVCQEWVHMQLEQLGVLVAPA